MITFFNSLAGRLILGGLLVHLLLLPVTVFGILYILETGIEDLFLDHTRFSSRLLADMLQTKDPGTETKDINEIIDSAVLAGQVEYAELVVNDQAIRGTLLQPVTKSKTFIDDFKFGQQGDSVYFMSLSLLAGPQKIPAVLRLGFAEHAAQEAIDLSRSRLIELIGGYVVLTTILLVFLSSLLTHSIGKLREASRTVAAGRFEDRLNVESKITDVQTLADDLEEMRSQLVKQTVAVTNANRLMSEQQERLIESETMAAAGEMASTMAHNIRNPLASIRSSAELTLDSDVSEDLKSTVQDIIKDVDRVGDWIQEFLSISRPQRTDLRSVVSVVELVNRCLAGFERQLKRNGINTRIPNSKPELQCLGDEHRLQQTFDILITNSIDAMPKGGLLIVEVHESNEDTVQIKISDTGVGIREVDLKKIFKPYFTGKQGGVGLGLFMVKRIVENHGGSISVSSQLGEGSTFLLTLPAVRKKKYKILVVDDEAHFTNNLEAYLNQYEYEVETAFNGHEGVEIFKTFKPEIVVLDVNLPDSNGFEVLSQMKRMDEQIKVVMVTGKGYIQTSADGSSHEIATIAQQAGADNCILKPISLKEIRKLLDATMASPPATKISLSQQ